MEKWGVLAVFRLSYTYSATKKNLRFLYHPKLCEIDWSEFARERCRWLRPALCDLIQSLPPRMTLLVDGSFSPPHAPESPKATSFQTDQLLQSSNQFSIFTHPISLNFCNFMFFKALASYTANFLLKFLHFLHIFTENFFSFELGLLKGFFQEHRIVGKTS